MSIIVDDIYHKDYYIIKQYGKSTVKIAYCSSVRKKGFEPLIEEKNKRGKGLCKLENNLSRAKATVKELALCNNWDYWCTLTINQAMYDRYNLKAFYTDFSRFIDHYNKLVANQDYKVKYLLVPEKHKDGAWHLHGFLRGINPNDLIRNQYGYLDWVSYSSKFGFISLDYIKDLNKASSYIQKYMTKDLEKNVTELNKRLFYASKNLERATVLYSGHGNFIGHYDWEHPDGYCKIKTLDLQNDNLYEYFEPFDKY